MSKIYRYEFWGVQGGGRNTYSTVHFWFIIQKTEKYKSMTYTKTKFYIILI